MTRSRRFQLLTCAIAKQFQRSNPSQPYVSHVTWVSPFCHSHLLMMSPSAFWLRWPRSVLFSDATNTSRMYRIAVLPHVMTAQVCYLCACAESDGIATQCQHSAAFTSVRLRIVSLITVLQAFPFGALVCGTMRKHHVAGLNKVRCPRFETPEIHSCWA